MYVAVVQRLGSGPNSAFDEELLCGLKFIFRWFLFCSYLDVLDDSKECSMDKMVTIFITGNVCRRL